MKVLFNIVMILGLLTSMGNLVQAQESPGFEPSEMWLDPSTDDFATIQQQVEAYYATRDKDRGSGYKQWKRWERPMTDGI